MFHVPAWRQLHWTSSQPVPFMQWGFLQWNQKIIPLSTSSLRKQCCIPLQYKGLPTNESSSGRGISLKASGSMSLILFVWRNNFRREWSPVNIPDESLVIPFCSILRTLKFWSPWNADDSISLIWLQDMFKVKRFVNSLNVSVWMVSRWLWFSSKSFSCASPEKDVLPTVAIALCARFRTWHLDRPKCCVLGQQTQWLECIF